MSKTGKRYSFWKICGVVVCVTIAWMLFALAVIYNVKISGSPYDVGKFNLVRYLESAGIALVFNVFFFYVLLNDFHRLAIEKGGFGRYVLCTAKGLILYVLYLLGSDYLVWRRDPFTRALGNGYFILSVVLSVVFYFGICLAIVHINILREEKKLRKLLEEQKRRLEMEKIQANYYFLKAQVNPHFLHNTLNFLYAKSLPYTAELSEGILTLSEIMRYSLDKPEDAEGRVPLAKEIEHVNNIIKIQQLRFDNTLQVFFEIKGDISGIRIIPFVLITIIENAFKHGELKCIGSPIRITLTVEKGSLQFRCVNKKKEGPKELSTGIGLDNTRKRLQLAYGDNYSLYTREQANLYRVDLNITL